MQAHPAGPWAGSLFLQGHSSPTAGLSPHPFTGLQEALWAPVWAVGEDAGSISISLAGHKVMLTGKKRRLYVAVRFLSLSGCWCGASLLHSVENAFQDQVSVMYNKSSSQMASLSLLIFMGFGFPMYFELYGITWKFHFEYLLIIQHKILVLLRSLKCRWCGKCLYE